MLASSSSIGKALVAGLVMVGCLACVFLVTSSEDTVLIEAETEAKATAALYEEKLGLIQKADPAMRAKILEAIVDLRAYSEIAYDAVEEYKKQNANTDMGLLEFVLQFAKGAEKIADDAGDKADRDRERKKTEAKAKKKAILSQDRDVDQALIEGRDPLPIRDGHDVDGCVALTEVWCESLNKCQSKKGEAVCPPYAPPYNVVVDYAKAIGKVRVTTPRGLGHYLAQHLDQAIMSGVSPIAKFPRFGKPVAGFDSKVLGLVELPKYFYMISTPFSKYESRRHKVKKDSSSADVAAAAMWLSKGSSDQYKTFMQRQQDIKNDKIEKYYEETASKSQKAIHKQFEKQVGDKDLYLRLHGLAAKGLNAAGSVDPPELRSQEQVAADAKKAAAEWVKANSADAVEQESEQVKKDEEVKEAPKSA